MVDQRARTILAEQLRHLVSARITNDEFNRRLSLKTEDTGFWAVEEQAWFLYSDTSQHKLIGPHALSKRERRIVCRYIIFLHSDLEYQWSPHPCKGLTRLALGIISFGQLPKYLDNKWKVQGDFSVYPFFRRSDFDKALLNPKLLSGGEKS